MNNIIKEDHPLTRKELFSKYKLNNKIFFETGTHIGDSVQIALDLNFNKILSVELDYGLYYQCCYKFTNEPKVKPWKYFNGGFQITSEQHIPFYKKVQEYYTTNISKINQLNEQIKAGTDQTIINYLVQQNNLDTVYMSEAYNLQDLFRKNLLHIPGHSWFPDELRFLEAGWIYHFNAIPQNDRHVDYWMERTYKELYT